MLRVHARQVETLWDELLPVEARALPEDLAQLDALLADPDLLAPFRARFAAEMETHAADPFSRGRPTISMATYLRRFCLIPLSAEVPDESTVRKLTRRLGPEVTDDLIRGLSAKALRERRFRPRALRADSTVAAADIRYPTDAGLAADAVRLLTRGARRVGAAGAAAPGAAVGGATSRDESGPAVAGEDHPAAGARWPDPRIRARGGLTE